MLIAEALLNFVTFYKESAELREDREDARMKLLIKVLRNQEESDTDVEASVCTSGSTSAAIPP